MFYSHIRVLLLARFYVQA